MNIQEQETQIKEEEKLEDILNSIRGIIEEKESNVENSNKDQVDLKENTISNIVKSKDQDPILELTNEINNEINNHVNESMLEEKVQKKTRDEIDKLLSTIEDMEYRQKKLKSFDGMVFEIMKPLIQEWLNNHLPTMVESLVRDEIKRLIPK